MLKIDINDLDKYFQKGELIPAIAFDVDVLAKQMDINRMVHQVADWRKTLETGYTWYWSRSRQELWNKGATSGHLQKVISIYSDCDDDTLLLNVKQTGAACHTGSYSCFFNEMYTDDSTAE
jgi:phosphoribosyl-AMP cyclohydrolase